MIAISIFFIYFVAFAFHAAQSIGPGAYGTLATTLSLGGLANPPGYPLLSACAHILNALPGETLFKYNLFSAAIAASVISVFYLSLRTIAPQRHWFLVGATLLVITPTFFIHATSFEKYGLNLLVLALSLYFALLSSQGPSKKIHLFASFLLLGLGFCTHYSTVPFITAATAFVAWKYKGRRSDFALAGFFTFIGLCPFCWILQVANKNPLFNWGGPKDFDSFLSYITREQYWTQSQASDGAELYRQFAREFQLFLENQGPLVLALSALGVVHLYRQKKKALALFFCVGFFLLGPFLTYGIHFQTQYINPVFEDFLHTHVSVFYLPLYYVAALAVATYGTQMRSWLQIVLMIFLIFRTTDIFVNYDRSKYQFTQNFIEGFAQARNDPGSKLVITHIDSLYFPFVFEQFHHPNQFHKSAVYLHVDLLRLEWFQDTLKQLYPEFYAKHQSAIQDYFYELKLFHQDASSQHASKMQVAFQRMMEGFIEQERQETFLLFYPDYYPAPQGLFDKYFVEPIGFGLKLHITPGEIKPLRLSNFDFKGLSNEQHCQDHWQLFMSAYYADNLAKRLQFIKNIDPKEARVLKSTLHSLAQPYQIKLYHLEN